MSIKEICCFALLVHVKEKFLAVLFGFGIFFTSLVSINLDQMIEKLQVPFPFYGIVLFFFIYLIIKTVTIQSSAPLSMIICKAKIIAKLYKKIIKNKK